ncbi:MAG: phage head-tail connector protein [Emcibacter sp.]|nr:phage head-tail connector protein [Emcibacter sp.]
MTQLAAPTSLPVTLQQVKAWLRLDDNESDAEILSLMFAATTRAEEITRRPFINRQYVDKLDCFPSIICPSEVFLRSVDSIEYVDSDGADQTLVPDQYLVDLGGKFKQGRIVPAYGLSWPSTRRQLSAVAITYTAGYGPDWNAVPEHVRIAICYLVGHYFHNREIVGTGGDIPETAMALLSSEKVPVL